jgi:hypothetical protein
MGRALNADAETVEVNGDTAEICSGTAAYLLGGSVDRTLLFGPVGRRPSERDFGAAMVVHRRRLRSDGRIATRSAFRRD